MSIVYVGDGDGHSFTHLHYLGWPDFGAPSHTEPIISLVKDVRNLINKSMKNCERKINVLVHCSAGVGRTGTFIVLYKIMEQLDFLVPKFDVTDDSTNQAIDIFYTAFSLRSKRVLMVKQH